MDETQYRVKIEYRNPDGEWVPDYVIMESFVGYPFNGEFRLARAELDIMLDALKAHREEKPRLLKAPPRVYIPNEVLDALQENGIILVPEEDDWDGGTYLFGILRDDGTKEGSLDRVSLQDLRDMVE
jgi:hypothetical protein